MHLPLRITLALNRDRCWLVLQAVLRSKITVSGAEKYAKTIFIIPASSHLCYITVVCDNEHTSKHWLRGVLAYLSDHLSFFLCTFSNIESIPQCGFTIQYH